MFDRVELSHEEAVTAARKALSATARRPSRRHSFQVLVQGAWTTGPLWVATRSGVIFRLIRWSLRRGA